MRVLAKVFECAQIADVMDRKKKKKMEKEEDGLGQYSMDDKTPDGDQRRQQQ